jgi:AbrB family looped-hinge helix DNA binding protein
VDPICSCKCSIKYFAYSEQYHSFVMERALADWFVVLESRAVGYAFLLNTVRMEMAMRITAKGQVTIPQDVRERAGLMPGTDVAFECDADGVRLVKAGPGQRRKSRGEKLVERLRGGGAFGMTTDEVIALMRGPAADEDVPPHR